MTPPPSGHVVPENYIFSFLWSWPTIPIINIALDSVYSLYSHLLLFRSYFKDLYYLVGSDLYAVNTVRTIKLWIIKTIFLHFFVSIKYKTLFLLIVIINLLNEMYLCYALCTVTQLHCTFSRTLHLKEKSPTSVHHTFQGRNSS